MNENKFKIPLYRLILQWINRAVGYIGSFGEVQLEPEKWRIIGHDGVTPGGIPLKTDIDDVIRAAVVAKTGSYNDLEDKPRLNFQPQLNGQGFVKVNGTTITYDDNKYANLAGADFTGPITCTTTISAYDFPLTTSDKREKRNIKKIDNLDRFANVWFKQFYLRRNSKRVHYGVIAQEVEQFAPELVSTDASGQKSVSYIEILIAKVALLEQEIEQLKTKNNGISS